MRFSWTDSVSRTVFFFGMLARGTRVYLVEYQHPPFTAAENGSWYNDETRFMWPHFPISKKHAWFGFHPKKNANKKRRPVISPRCARERWSRWTAFISRKLLRGELIQRSTRSIPKRSLLRNFVLQKFLRFAESLTKTRKNIVENVCRRLSKNGAEPFFPMKIVHL